MQFFDKSNLFFRIRAKWKSIYKNRYLPIVLQRRHKKYLKGLKSKDHVNVVFLPMAVSIWKYQQIYKLLKSDPRFNVYVFLTPATTFTENQRIEDLKAMRAYFTERGIDFIDYELEKNKPLVDIRSIVDPDILFYTQPYLNVVDENRKVSHFLDKLICYSPYGFKLSKLDMFYNSLFSSVAWKLYYQTELNKKTAERLCRNHGRNVVVSGYLGAEEYFTEPNKDVWKEKDRRKKRIIWAPHFTILKGIGFYKSSYFLEMADFMQKIAIDYADKITIAFKPHPRLYSELCKHPDWGEEKAKDYYDFWEKSENTQVETGDFVDLFKGSDAMIHDSNSFVVDYLYFNKPVLFDNPDIEGVKTTADTLGVTAFDAHYRVSNLNDIKSFIDDVVINGTDPMKQTRMDFYDNYLKPKDGKSSSQIIYEDIVNSIWGDKDV